MEKNSEHRKSNEENYDEWYNNQPVVKTENGMPSAPEATQPTVHTHDYNNQHNFNNRNMHGPVNSFNTENRWPDGKQPYNNNHMMPPSNVANFGYVQPVMVLPMQAQRGPYVEPHYTWSIVNLICSFFFCWLGFYAAVPAYIYSRRVRYANFYGRYDIKTAQRYSKLAKIFNIISTVIWGTWLVLFAIYIIVRMATS